MTTSDSICLDVPPNVQRSSIDHPRQQEDQQNVSASPQKPSEANDNEDIKETINSRRGLSPWTSDFACLAGSFASIITLVVLLDHYDQSPLKPWIWGITLNGVIAAISFIWKACMSFVLSNSIGQLKWRWFWKNKQFDHLQAFDDASRGGIAGFRLLGPISWPIARLAGLVVVLTIAFDPFVQQLVNFPTVTIRQLSDNVTITRGVTYTMEGPTQASLQSARKAGVEDHYFAENIVGSILLDRYTTSLQGIMGLHCPVGSNCTWDLHPTLGLCTECANLTDADWDTTCQGHPADCSYHIPGVAQFDARTPSANSTASLFESKEVPSNVSEHWFNISNPLLTIASLRLSQKSNYPPQNVTVCAFYPCVRTVTSTSVIGEADIGMVRSWRNTSSSAAVRDMNTIPEALPDIYMKPTPGDLGLDNDMFKDDVYYISAAVANLTRKTLRSVLLVRVWGVDSSWGYSFSHSGYGNSAIVAKCYGITTGYTVFFDTISLAATYYIRSMYENRKNQITGYINTEQTIINVQWPWIIYPLSIFVLILLVFIFTVWITRHETIWKNSTLPLCNLAEVSSLLEKN